MKSSADTRTCVTQKFALIAPDGWVTSTLPGWSECQIHVIINPAMGAEFSQLLVFMQPGATGKEEGSSCEHFLYVMEGRGEIQLDRQQQQLTKGSFAFVPAQSPFEINSAEGLKMTVFQKVYKPLKDFALPHPIIGNAGDVPSELYMDDSQLHMQHLLPDDMAFDMAINIFTYDPGGNLPFVETHVMEHGLIYLAGQGIYRLDDRWFPVMKDDCIWMAPFCPQWFVAMGKGPAVYLYYKNVNRHPLDQ